MTLEKINKIATKFNENYYIASQRYDEPKCAFAAVLTVVEVIEDMKSDEQFKEILEAQREVKRAFGLK